MGQQKRCGYAVGRSAPTSVTDDFADADAIEVAAAPLIDARSEDHPSQCVLDAIEVRLEDIDTLVAGDTLDLKLSWTATQDEANLTNVGTAEIEFTGAVGSAMFTLARPVRFPTDATPGSIFAWVRHSRAGEEATATIYSYWTEVGE